MEGAGGAGGGSGLTMGLIFSLMGTTGFGVILITQLPSSSSSMSSGTAEEILKFNLAQKSFRKLLKLYN